MSHVDDGTLHAYLDGELAPAEARGVAAHVAQCPACRNRLDEERGLIARADQLLGLAAPPDRQIPPFRAGDLKPPARLWWQVRLPLAWAATLVLAWAAGWYVRSGLNPQPSLDRDVAMTRDTTANDVAAVVEKQSRVTRGARPPRRERAQAADTAAQPAAQPVSGVADVAFEPQAKKDHVPREPTTPAPPPLAAGNAALAPTPLTLDSARALLGTDPLAVPGLPVRGIYKARRIGYSAVVIVEQALDSSTVIAVINGRPSLAQLEAVVVSNEARPDSATPAEGALLGRVKARVADSLAPAARKADAAPPPAPGAFAYQTAAGLLGEVRGPLSADSLAALQRRLQPLRP